MLVVRRSKNRVCVKKREMICYGVLKNRTPFDSNVAAKIVD